MTGSSSTTRMVADIGSDGTQPDGPPLTPPGHVPDTATLGCPMRATETRLTIGELADRVGMSTRNIRAHQTRGLLPPPTIEGRTGWYTPAHESRLRTIQRLQDQGLNLQAIGLLLKARDGDPEVDDVRRALVEPPAAENPEVQRAADVLAGFGGDVPAELVQRAVDLGLFEPIDGELTLVLVPSALRSGVSLFRAGVPVAELMGAAESVDAAARRVAETYVGLVRDHLVPGIAADVLALTPDEIRASLGELRLAAGEVLLTMFQRAMTEAADRLVDELTEE